MLTLRSLSVAEDRRLRVQGCTGPVLFSIDGDDTVDGRVDVEHGCGAVDAGNGFDNNASGATGGSFGSLGDKARVATLHGHPQLIDFHGGSRGSNNGGLDGGLGGGALAFLVQGTMRLGPNHQIVADGEPGELVVSAGIGNAGGSGSGGAVVIDARVIVGAVNLDVDGGDAGVAEGSAGATFDPGGEGGSGRVSVRVLDGELPVVTGVVPALVVVGRAQTTTTTLTFDPLPAHIPRSDGNAGEDAVVLTGVNGFGQRLAATPGIIAIAGNRIAELFTEFDFNDGFRLHHADEDIVDVGIADSGAGVVDLLIATANDVVRDIDNTAAGGEVIVAAGVGNARLVTRSTDATPFVAVGQFFRNGSSTALAAVDATVLTAPDRFALLVFGGFEVISFAEPAPSPLLPVTGVTVASRIAGDGDLVVVGRPDDNVICGPELGSAAICRADGSCVDVCPDIIRLPYERQGNPLPRRAFGRSVAVAGNLVAVADIGHVTVFTVDLATGVPTRLRSEFSDLERELTEVAISGAASAGPRLVWGTTAISFQDPFQQCASDADCTAPNTCVETACRDTVGDVVIAELP